MVGMTGFWPHGRRPGKRLAGWMTALVLCAITLLGGVLGAGGIPSPRGSAATVGIAVAVVSGAVAAAHDRLPRTVTAVTAGCGALAVALGLRANPLLLSPVMFSLFWLAVRTDRRTTRNASFGAAALLTGAAVVFGPGSWLEPEKAAVLAWTLLPGAAGDAVHSRRAYLAAMEERAERAERTREEEARRRVAEERVRIARDLHDVVAHHIALANAQAGVAVHLMSKRPDQALAVLRQITDTTGSALQELKATVGLLRQADDAEAPLEPAPGLAQLPTLIEAFGHAGLEVAIRREGEEQPVSPGVDLTAYRIVQEALTNVTKHAHTRAACVTLRYTGSRLVITVEDNGSPQTRRPDSAPGYGLLGMRERAAAVGGLLLAGRRPEGGFRVSTELPLRTGDRDRDGATDRDGDRDRDRDRDSGEGSPQ
ncbi:histidine kinase [Streptomyces sp. A3M-1-3]|uniref:sensor histidine kinase n=1 Tax=Streptomyces sp. A3M-1-3 TaxID=2962044 RepID=UPI0020B80EB8|nr:histidine kinase [Streptomyces sp. A3M-1-3]MCP3822051.1 histidine kinase [Streptomyces sp. A3M-1-3]